MDASTPKERQALQIKHCMRRLKERFDLGQEHYYQILNRLANGGGRLRKPSDYAPNTYVVRMNYLGNKMNVVVDSKNSHLLTVYK